MNTNDIKTIELVVNAEQARQKLDEINKQLDVARKKKEEAFNKGDNKGYVTASKEVQRLEREVAKVETRAQGMAKTLKNLDKAAPNDLRKVIREINKELSSGKVERNSKEWEKLTEALVSAKSELAAITAEQKAIEAVKPEKKSFFSEVLNMGTRLMGIVTTISGISDMLGNIKALGTQYVNLYARMEEAQSGVIKYTGMTKEAVADLNEEFKKMDTRTAREQLNALAADAGRLGIQAKDQILDFVEAANVINVALGEDLGEDAVKNIGKLAQLFGDEKALGLKGAMLASASTINELAQTSSASEPYIMDFTARLAGVGKQAHMTQAQIMAYGAVLDTSMVSQEKGATALQNVITALYRKPAEMAKVAGLDVKMFSETLRRDGNAALMMFIEALNRAGNMDALAPMLEQMHLSGAGVTQTLSALANNIDNLRETQVQATAAFLDAKSVQEEYEKANNTVEAQLEKAKKKFLDLSIELGEHLLPIMSKMTSATSLSVKGLLSLIHFVSQNKAAVASLTVTFAVWVGFMLRAAIAARAVAAWEAVLAARAAVLNGVMMARRAIILTGIALWKLMQVAYFAATGQTAALEMAQRRLNAAMRANPWGLVASLIATAVSAIMLFVSLNNKAAGSVSALAKQQQVLTAAKEKAAQATAKERASLEVLLRIVEDGNRSYDERKKALDALNAAVPAYHGLLSKSGRLERANRKAVLDYIAALEDKATAEALYEDLVEAKKKKLQAQRKVTAKQNNVKAVDNELKKKQYESKKVAVYTSAGAGAVSVQTGTVEGNDLRTQKLKERTTQVQALTTAQQDLNDAEQKEQAILAQANDPKYKKHFAAAATRSGGEDTRGGGAPAGETEAQRRAREKAERERERQERERLKAAQKEVEAKAHQERAQALVKYAQGIIDSRDYNDELLRIEDVRLTALRDLQEKGSEEWSKYEQQRLENDKKVREQYHAWSIAELNSQEKEEVFAADMQHAHAISSEEEHEAQLAEIKLRYIKARAKMAREFGQADKAEDYEQQYLEESNRQKLKQQEAYLKQLEALRKEFGDDPQKRYNLELETLETLHEKKLLSEEEYLKLREALRLKYEGTDNGKTTGEIGKSRTESAKKALDMAGYTKPENAGGDASKDFGISGLGAAAAAINQARAAHEQLKRLYEDGKISYQQYTDACKQLDDERFTNFQNAAQAAFATVGAIMGAASNLMAAEKNAETARVEAEYDQQIKAAGNNSARTKMLEEKKAAEIAKIKSKYAKREAAMQIAQAIAQTAMNALMAYGSVVKIPIVGPALAVAAAAAATAAGLIQVAAISKQAEAQEKGYFSGGFTGGSNYRRRAGIVHEGEFVANHEALANPNVLPVLRLIDYAQRTNTIGTLTAHDVSRAVNPNFATTAQTAIAETAQHVQVVPTESAETVAAVRELKDTLERGISATVVLDGPNGLERQWERFKNLKKRK